MLNNKINTNVLFVMRRRMLACLFVLATCLSLISCLDPLTGDDHDENYNTAMETLFEGRWQVDDKQSMASMMMLATRVAQIENLPLYDVLGRLMPESEITDVVADAGNGIVAYDMVSQSDGNTVLSLYPRMWRLTASVDGKYHGIQINFTSPSNNENMSWGTITQAGVATLILRATSYSVDDGESRPISLKLTFVATRSKQ